MSSRTQGFPVTQKRNCGFSLEHAFFFLIYSSENWTFLRNPDSIPTSSVECSLSDQNGFYQIVANIWLGWAASSTCYHTQDIKKETHWELSWVNNLPRLQFRKKKKTFKIWSSKYTWKKTHRSVFLNLDHPELLLRRGAGGKAGFWRWWHFSFFRTKTHCCLLDWATSGLTMVSLQSLMGWSVTAAHQVINGWTKVIYPYSGILAFKGWSTDACYKMDEPWKLGFQC